jgi:hypothetical protein
LKTMSLKADGSLRHDVCPKASHFIKTGPLGLDLSDLDTGLSSSAWGAKFKVSPKGCIQLLAAPGCGGTYLVFTDSTNVGRISETRKHNSSGLSLRSRSFGSVMHKR